MSPHRPCQPSFPSASSTQQPFMVAFVQASTTTCYETQLFQVLPEQRGQRVSSPTSQFLQSSKTQFRVLIFISKLEILQRRLKAAWSLPTAIPLFQCRLACSMDISARTIGDFFFQEGRHCVGLCFGGFPVAHAFCELVRQVGVLFERPLHATGQFG